MDQCPPLLDPRLSGDSLLTRSRLRFLFPLAPSVPPSPSLQMRHETGVPHSKWFTEQRQHHLRYADHMLRLLDAQSECLRVYDVVAHRFIPPPPQTRKCCTARNSVLALAPKLAPRKSRGHV